MLFVASALMVVLAVGHSIFGERFILGPLGRLPEPPRLAGQEFPLATVRFAWHVASGLSITIAAALFAVAVGAGPAAAIATAGWCLAATAVLPFVYSRARHPSWIVLAAAGAFCVLWSFSVG
ncbi:hypothetical protein [Agromyces italicus]|uniref:hypothetical protein n=1 Tax=Agromyces italicus TaxID=279572 RepID=UPI0012FCD979|nr:hypothetical protein [Agromyces italicus]